MNGGENSIDIEIVNIKRIDGQKGLRGIIDVRFGGQVTVFGFTATLKRGIEDKIIEAWKENS